MKKKIYFLFILFLFLSFDLVKISSYKDLEFIIPLFTGIGDNKDQESGNLEKNIRFFEGVVFNTAPFLFSREAVRKGFDREVQIEFKPLGIKYDIIKYEETDGFYRLFYVRVPLNEQRKQRIENFTKTSGYKTYGEYGVSYLDWFDSIQNAEENQGKTLFIYILEKACENLVANAVELKYGRNFMLDVRGSFLVIQQPQYIVNNGYLYIKFNGLVFIDE